MEQKTCLGIIGGSGLYDLNDLLDAEEWNIETPFGMPSDTLVRGRIGNISVVFLSRHGRGHRFTPTEVNYRANIYAMKKAGVSHILSVSAVGSLREELAPGMLVLPTQLLDRTTGIRSRSFFSEGVVGHVGFADPFCPWLQSHVRAAGQAINLLIGDGGTLVVIEGPRFSTRAESHIYRQLNAHIIGMTALPEAALAREAEIAYCTLALVTDYDCWKEHEAAVDVASVVAVMQANVANSKAIICELCKALPPSSSNSIFSAAEHAIMTATQFIPIETKRKLDALYGKYWRK